MFGNKWCHCKEDPLYYYKDFYAMGKALSVKLSCMWTGLVSYERHEHFSHVTEKGHNSKDSAQLENVQTNYSLCFVLVDFSRSGPGCSKHR